MTKEEILSAYAAAGGTKPAVFWKGFAEAGRFGQNGELADVPETDAPDYAAGVMKAQEVRNG